MAILCLANDMADLKERLGKIIVAYNMDREPVTAKDLNAVGAMAALLKDAIKPNMIQTLEHTSGHQLHASYIPTKRIPEMLRIFGSCRTFYEIHSTRGLCVLGSKEGYANYLSSEVVPALREEFPSR